MPNNDHHGPDMPYYMCAAKTLHHNVKSLFNLQSRDFYVTKNLKLSVCSTSVCEFSCCLG